VGAIDEHVFGPERAAERPRAEGFRCIVARRDEVDS
jgi:hypothetical protein